MQRNQNYKIIKLLQDNKLRQKVLVAYNMN